MKKLGADSTQLVVADTSEIELKLAARSEAVRQRIDEIKNDFTNKSLELGRLLKEARDNAFHFMWGYARFGDWVDAEMANFGIKQREAYYLVSIVERAEQLQLPDEQLKRVGISKLKLILSLPPEQNDTAKQLVADAENTPLSTIKEAVEVAKGSEFTYLNLKLPRIVKENVVLPAFEKARRIAGNTISGGEVVDLADWQCLEACCMAMINEAEEQQDEVIDAEYADVVDNDGSCAYGMGDREV